MIVQRPKAANQARAEGDWPSVLAEIAACETHQELEDWWMDHCLRRARELPPEWLRNAQEAVEAQRDEITGRMANRDMDRLVGEIAGLR